MKKVYVKPILIKLGDLESFVKGSGGAGPWIDYYSNSCGADFEITNISCGGSNVGVKYSCSPDPGSNYFVFSDKGECT